MHVIKNCSRPIGCCICSFAYLRWFFGDQFLSPEAITGRGNGHALFRIDLYLMAAILSPRRTRSSVSCVPASVRDKGLWGPSKSVCFWNSWRKFWNPTSLEEFDVWLAIGLPFPTHDVAVVIDFLLVPLFQFWLRFGRHHRHAIWIVHFTRWHGSLLVLILGGVELVRKEPLALFGHSESDGKLR